MRIDPANVNQVREAEDGSYVEIDKDVGGVAEDLKRIDPGLKVRFSPSQQFFAVYHESEDKRTTYLVLTVKAHRNRLGVWEGLDQRVVKRIMEIGHSTYDYGAELEAHNRRLGEQKKAEIHERMGEQHELAAHAIRKDLGERYKGRAFMPRKET